MEIIRIENFSFRINGKLILDDISLKVQEGEFTAVIGPNGAGKSTLLRCIDRIWRGGEGDIYVYGKELKDYSQRELAKIVSYVPQMDVTMYPYTVEEFVLMGLYPYLNPFASISRKHWQNVEWALEKVKMSEFSQRSMDSLSGGERQKIFIATSLIQGAKILLLDEPTTFLDPNHQEEIYSILRSLNKESDVAMMMVTHDINHAVLVSSRVIGLSGGQKVYDGDASGVMNNDILFKLYRKEFLLVPHPKGGQLITVPENFAS